MRVFVDSDVLISSLLSFTGAAYFLLHRCPTITPVVSTYSLQELEIVAHRMRLSKKKLRTLQDDILEVVPLTERLEKIKQQYQVYVDDHNDAHIVAGAVAAKVDFLITYNVKDFKKNIISEELEIVVMTPGLFLQYLRSS